MKLNAAKYVQLIPEGLFFYFLMVPVFSYTNHALPLWSYIGLVILTVLLTDIGRQLTQRLVIYLPILAIIFVIGVFGFSYPVVAPFFLGLFLFWREDQFSQGGRSEQPLLIVALSIILILVEMVFVGNPFIVWIGVIEFVTIIIGQWLLFLMSYGTFKQHVRSLFLKSAGAVIGGGLLLYLLFPVISQSIKTIYSGLEWGVLSTVYGITRLFGLENMALPELTQEAYDKMVEPLDSGDDSNNAGFKPGDQSDAALDSTNFINIWTISGLVLILGIVAFFLYRKKRQVDYSDATSGGAVAYRSTLEKSHMPSDQQYRGMANVSAPEDPIRKNVFQFEGEAHQLGYGRKPGETVEEWLMRIGFEANELNMYQRVRYGEHHLSDQERMDFEKRLKQLNKQLKNQ